MLLRITQEEYEIFDSLGTSDEYVLQNIHFLGDCHLNTTILQDETSISCGQFCIFYIIHRLHNLDLDYSSFLNDFFSENVGINEERVSTFLTNI